MELIVICHGETKLTAEDRCTGWIEDILTTKGEVNAESLAVALPHDVTAIYTSPLAPALATAAIIGAVLGKRENEIVIDDRLKERNPGTLAGLTWGEVRERTGRNLRYLDEIVLYEYERYHGESHRQVRFRVAAAVETIHNTFADTDKVVVVVSERIGEQIRDFFRSQGQELNVPIESGGMYRFNLLSTVTAR